MSQPTRITWTNRSVLKFAGGSDPIELIEAKARELVLRARDVGWSGPPYNPVAIADLLHIPVEASGDVADARTIPTASGVRIEFNPTLPRERMRFSIAHEIAHTLFSDVAEKTRHRAGVPHSSDEWQLEMLCNLAAAEFVMPLGSLPSTGRLPRVEDLMTERRKFDVSAEAFIIRMLKAAAEPALMVCASNVAEERAKPSYRIDYGVASISAPAVPLRGLQIPETSVIYSCTAIGQTNRAKETWLTGSQLTTECVAIPSFIGSIYPRVIAIIRFHANSTEPEALNMLHGDVLKPAGGGPKIICQLVNDQAKTWGGGVARATAKMYPAAQKQYSDWIAHTPKRNRLGMVHFADVENDIIIASLVAQEGFGASSAPRIRYAPLDSCFRAVAKCAAEGGATVHMPKIGSGASGGAWDTIEQIVRDTLVAKGIAVTVYEVPPRRQNTGAERLL